MERAKDTFRSLEFNNIKLPRIKGHVKVILHNPRTGKNEIKEGDNIVTNAMADIFDNNYMGGISNNLMMPLWQKWMSGILLYENPFATSGDPAEPDPDDYFIEGNGINPLKGHAGPTVPSGTDLMEDRTRGYRIDTVLTDGKVKQVFEFGSLQGNGIISALALTHRDTGDAGTGNTSTVFHNFQPFERIDQLPSMSANLKSGQNVVAQYDDNHGLIFYIGEDGDFRPSHTVFTTSKVTVYIRKMAYKTAGLYETIDMAEAFERKFTVTTSIGFLYQPSYYFDKANKRLWLFTNITGSSTFRTSFDKKYISYTVIDCENETEYAHGTIESDASDLAPLSMDYPVGTSDDHDSPNYFNIPKIGNYFYFPTSAMESPTAIGRTDINANGLKKINITNTGDQTTVPFNEVSTQWGSAMTGGGLIIKSGRIINNGIGYTCADYFGYHQDQYPAYAFSQPDAISSYAVTLGGRTTVTRPRLILANKLIHTTKFNLPEAIRKDNTKSLTIEYTLEEVAT